MPQVSKKHDSNLQTWIMNTGVLSRLVCIDACGFNIRGLVWTQGRWARGCRTVRIGPNAVKTFLSASPSDLSLDHSINALKLVGRTSGGRRNCDNSRQRHVSSSLLVLQPNLHVLPLLQYSPLNITDIVSQRCCQAINL